MRRVACSHREEIERLLDVKDATVGECAHVAVSGGVDRRRRIVGGGARRAKERLIVGHRRFHRRSATHVNR